MNKFIRLFDYCIAMPSIELEFHCNFPHMYLTFIFYFHMETFLIFFIFTSVGFIFCGSAVNDDVCLYPLTFLLNRPDNINRISDEFQRHVLHVQLPVLQFQISNI